jgi:hypothetical protein
MNDNKSRVIRYRCGTTGHTVPLRQMVATVSGLGLEESEDVVLGEECGSLRGAPLGAPAAARWTGPTRRKATCCQPPEQRAPLVRAPGSRRGLRGW